MEWKKVRLNEEELRRLGAKIDRYTEEALKMAKTAAKDSDITVKKTEEQPKEQPEQIIKAETAAAIKEPEEVEKRAEQGTPVKKAVPPRKEPARQQQQQKRPNKTNRTAIRVTAQKKEASKASKTSLEKSQKPSPKTK